MKYKYQNVCLNSGPVLFIAPETASMTTKRYDPAEFYPGYTGTKEEELQSGIRAHPIPTAYAPKGGKKIFKVLLNRK